MASRPRHARPRTSRLSRAGLSAGLTLTAASAAVLSGSGAAQADVIEAESALSSVRYAVEPITEIQLNPLAKTGVDPLDNGVGTQIADFRPISTTDLTGPLADGASLADLADEATGLLGGPRT